MMGGRCRDGTVAALRVHHHRACAPTLLDEHSCSLADHVGLICELMRENNVKEVILVGHSYGGMVITGAAARMPRAGSAISSISMPRCRSRDSRSST